MCVESFGKPDAWKLARPVWGWGQGVIPWPTPPRNLPRGLKTILGNCLAHGRRKVVDVEERFPEDCRHVLELLAVVYHNDALAKERNLSPAERLLLHQADSGPVMKELHTWLGRQFDEHRVEPNSALGAGIA